MTYLRSKKNNNNIMLLALSDSDNEVLKLLYDNSVVFGFYSYQNVSEITNNERLNKLKLIYPTLVSVGYINMNSEFVPKTNLELFDGRH